MSDKYDRKGNPLGLMEWAKLIERDDYKRIAETTLPDGTWISTVWLGLDHRLGNGPPLIFETMVFSVEGTRGDERDCERHSTEEEARAGHRAMVAKWSREGNATDRSPTDSSRFGTPGCADSCEEDP